MVKLREENEVTLEPARLSDRREIYNWLAHSDFTAEMMGPPDFPDHSIPTFEEFKADYEDYFFDGSKPLKGRSYLILLSGKPVGQINYQSIDQITNGAELDIWLASSDFTGKGIGPKAIELLCQELFELSFKVLLIAPSARNLKAIRVYEKAGFVKSTDFESDEPDYDDAVVLVRFLS